MKKTIHHHRHHERGSILAVALLVSVFMVIVAIPFVAKFSAQFRTTEKSYKSLAALNLAEAGVERAIWEMNYGDINTWSGSSSLRTMTISNVQASGGATVGSIQVNVFNPQSDNPVVESTGTVTLTGSQSMFKTLRIVLQSNGPPPLFDFGIFGNTGVTLSNNAFIDSYDSRLGAYGGSNIGHNGNTGTNSTSSGSLYLNNNAVIDGDALSGYESNPATAIYQGHHSSITGEKEALSLPKDLPSVPPPTGLTYRGDYAVAKNQSTTISQDGEYENFLLNKDSLLEITSDVILHITGTFTMDNNAEFRIRPGCSVRIYFGGNWSFGTNILINNQTQDPTQLIMYGTDTFTGTKIFNNNNLTYAGMYFPRANLALSNNAAIYGSVIANSINQSNNAPIHYDEALGSFEADFDSDSTGFSVKSWQEKLF